MKIRLVAVALFASIHAILARGDETVSDAPLPRLALIVSEFEYRTHETLPQFAREHLEKNFRVSYLVNSDEDNHDLGGLMRVLSDTDIVVLSVWRRALPKNQLNALRQYVDSGKPIVAIRTTCHGFTTRDGKVPNGRALWAEFDREVLGCHYTGHHGNKGSDETITKVWTAKNQGDHPILRGVTTDEITVASWLYKVSPLSDSAKPLLMGRAGDRKPDEPVAWTNKTVSGGRVFFTTLGHPEDFKLPAFERLLANGIAWAAGK